MLSGVTGLAVLAFLGELALLAALAVAGARLGGGAPLAVALPLLLAVVWGRWLSPRAPRPLGRGARTAAMVALVVVAAGLLAASGLPGWGAALLLGVGAVFGLAERQAG